MAISTSETYLLGVNQTELDRLRFQHQVWKSTTDAFFDRLKVQQGWVCLDVGSGPGFVSMDLCERVGESGEVIALDPSDYYLDWLRRESEGGGWKNLKTTLGTAETANLPKSHFNLIFVRWVIAFVPDPKQFLTSLISSLKPGGVIAIMDYYYEGLSLYPQGGAFDRAPEAVRKYYRSGGGDPYVTGRIPELFRDLGLRLIDFTPQQIAGGPESDIVEWAHRFFVPHLPLMADKGVITKAEAEAMVEDWMTHRRNLNTIFFTPIVIHVAGQQQE